MVILQPHIFTWTFSKVEEARYIVAEDKKDLPFLFNCMFNQNFSLCLAWLFFHNPGVVYYHLLLRQETRIPGVAPFSF